LVEGEVDANEGEACSSYFLEIKCRHHVRESEVINKAKAQIHLYMHLYNIQTCKLIHHFVVDPKDDKNENIVFSDDPGNSNHNIKIYEIERDIVYESNLITTISQFRVQYMIRLTSVNKNEEEAKHVINKILDYTVQSSDKDRNTRKGEKRKRKTAYHLVHNRFKTG
jgi:hypothetical protein